MLGHNRALKEGYVISYDYCLYALRSMKMFFVNFDKVTDKKPLSAVFIFSDATLLKVD